MQNTTERRTVYGCITAQIVEIWRSGSALAPSRSVLDLSGRSLLGYPAALRVRPPGGNEVEITGQQPLGFHVGDRIVVGSIVTAVETWAG